MGERFSGSATSTTEILTQTRVRMTLRGAGRLNRRILRQKVLQVFYVTVTRKIAKPLSRREAREIVEDLSVWCIDTTAVEVAAAFRIEDEAKISFWDALICASALKSGATVLLSEDMNSGQQIAGLRIENPFAD
jgi:predicted nucleic acid-binding protein